jgi:hypothetical protein
MASPMHLPSYRDVLTLLLVTNASAKLPNACMSRALILIVSCTFDITAYAYALRDVYCLLRINVIL